MGVEEKTLQQRLEKIWETPNFSSFFKKYSKRPPLRIKKGNTIFYEGDQPERVYFIKKGFVKLYHLSTEGKSTVIYLYGPGGMLGLRALTGKNQCLRHNAEALTDVEILTISRRDYLNILNQNPNYLIDLLHAFIERLNVTERKLEGFITTDATARIANFISTIGVKFGEPALGCPDGKKGNGTIIPVPLTHQLIAEFVGSVRETVTIALNNLEKEGVLKIGKGKITILNPRKLAQHTTFHKK